MKMKHKYMHHMHATLNFSRNSNNSDMLKNEQCCAPAPPRDPLIRFEQFLLL